ncbi:hypothetical protein [Nocardiopsis sp. FR26]|uniref:hypothetical protein n=1 Tax=Nocardiopsis sp. FR26 TaxID=2605987 RepID=UPI0013592520|nr:hypothetical protein [Nocardiopsis sp. FR26]
MADPRPLDQIAPLPKDATQTTATDLGAYYAALTAYRLGRAQTRQDQHGSDSEWMWLVSSAAQSFALAHLLRALQHGTPADQAAAEVRTWMQDSLVGELPGEWLAEWGRPGAAEEAYLAGERAPLTPRDAAPVAARWDRIVTRDEDGTTWVLCTTETKQPVALALDEEHAEALAGSLLDTDDGEELLAGGRPPRPMTTVYLPGDAPTEETRTDV